MNAPHTDAPRRLDLKDLTKHDGSLGGIREKTYSYYKVSRDWN